MKYTRPELCSALIAMALACGSEEDGYEADGGARPGDSAQASVDAGTSVSGDAASAPRDASGPRPASDGGSQACATVRASAMRLPVNLAFAFDVSGSMGKGDEEWHDKTLKWDPVVKATRAFFEAEIGADQAAPELSASLTFFPAKDDKCELASYAEPDVPMTMLPSPKFAEAIAAIEPKSEDDWRGGTPTLFALRGTRSFVESNRLKQPGKYAIVLVTDGYPQGCDDEEDSIEAVVAEAQAARLAGISTYVIGVANPKIDDAPDTVSDLSAIAAAGGTERAFIIDTGDPQATTSAFDAAIERIRESTLSCNMTIPAAPDGRPFDKRRVVVRASLGGGMRDLRYDASCALADAWRYDDESAPKEIVLCPSSCSLVEGDVSARVDVAFACEDLLYL